ncbi:hypothetical protein DBV15_11088 [Temnothorax longispinosus]|uniref:Uncharacterized protein n=1 Tax=Temnothorax longispinosus TaxID=300112 RepID=A0A4S2JBC6_9HYME|nr:hypothetical protein DBV15_11088 [Temnothorax longispinosus]
MLRHFNKASVCLTMIADELQFTFDSDAQAHHSVLFSCQALSRLNLQSKQGGAAGLRQMLRSLSESKRKKRYE